MINIQVEGNIINTLDQVGRSAFDSDIPKDKRTIQFGLPEILLLTLFLVAFLQRKYFKGPTSNIIRWITLLTGMILLGFIYNRPFVLAHVNMVLLGYFPAWDTHIYWYILIKCSSKNLYRLFLKKK